MYGDGKTEQEAYDSMRMLAWAFVPGLLSVLGGVVWLLLR